MRHRGAPLGNQAEIDIGPLPRPGMDIDEDAGTVMRTFRLRARLCRGGTRIQLAHKPAGSSIRIEHREVNEKYDILQIADAAASAALS
jgi:hypothetical protein